MSDETSIWKKEIHLTRRGKTAEPPPAIETAVTVWPPPELEPEPALELEWQTPKRDELWIVPDLEPDSIGPDLTPTSRRVPELEPAPELFRELELVAEPVEPEPKNVKGRSKEKKASRAKAGTKIVGLRIGSTQFSAALVNNTTGAPELLRLARAPLARGIVAAGEVRDPEALAQALKKFFSQNKLPRRGVRLGVATNRIGVRVIEVPVADDPKQLENAIRFRAHEVVPIPLAEAVLDHALLDQIDGENGERLHRVLLVFAHRELVDGYLNACKRAGVKLLGIDFDAFALLRALSNPPGESSERKGALVAVAIGHERTIFAVSDGSVCDFARVLDWGGSSLDGALVRALNLEPERAEQVRQSVPLVGEMGVGGLSPVELEAARAAIRSELQVLARELLSSLQFYQSRVGSLDIGEVLLTGGTAQLAGIELELGNQLGVPVRIGDPLQGVTMRKLKRPADAASLGIAVGLGIDR